MPESALAPPEVQINPELMMQVMLEAIEQLAEAPLSANTSEVVELIKP